MPTPQATPFDNILAQCRDLACERLTLALSGMIAKADESLTALIHASRDPNAQKLYLVSRNKVLSQKDTIEKQFRMRLLREFQERSNRVKKIGESFAAMDLSSLELELVAEEDLNETLKFNAMAAKLRQYCEEELVALDQRIGVLIGDASLQAEDNPFNPQSICDAYKQTCRQLDSNVDVRMVLLKLFDDHVLDDIRAVYKDVNDLLVQNQILPKIRVQRTRGAGSADAEATEAGGEKDLFSVLQKLLVKPAAAASPPGAGIRPGQPASGAPGTMPVAGGASEQGGGAVSGGSPVAQGADLMRSLTRIQLGDGSGVAGLPLTVVAGDAGTTNILHELKGTSLANGMNQMDAMTLDIMAMLFDQLFDDPKIPANVKGVIGRLQIPMLKVAISDKSFFSKKTHPARRMLDALGEIAARMPADVDASDDVFRRLESILQELIDGFEEDVSIFDVIRERLQAVVVEEDQRAEQETASAAKQIEQKESLALAKTVAQAEIRVRVRASDAPRPVIDFLVQQWLKLLLVVHVRDGEESEMWRNALETVDLLLWSVEPKETLEDRRALVSTVPDLLKRLLEGMNDGGIEESVRVEFFGELRRTYSALLGRTANSESAEAKRDEQDESQKPRLADPAGSATPGELDALAAEASGLQPSSTPDEALKLSAPDSSAIAMNTVAPAGAATPDEASDAPLEFAIELPTLESPAVPQATTQAGGTAPDSKPMFELPSLTTSPEASQVAPLPSAGASAPSQGLELVPIEIPELPPIAEPEPVQPVAPASIPGFDLPVIAPAVPSPPVPVPRPSIAPANASEAATQQAMQQPGQKQAPAKSIAAAQAPAAAPPAAAKPAAPAASARPAAPAPSPPSPASAAKAPVPPRPPAPAAPGTAPKSLPTPARPAGAPMPPAAAAPQPRPAPARPATPAASGAPTARPTAPASARPAAPVPGMPPATAATMKKSAPAAPEKSESLDFTAAVTVKNPFGGGEVQVNDLDFTQPAGKGSGVKREADPAALPDELAVGSWVEIREKGVEGHKLAKLSFVTPLKTRYLFVNRRGNTVLECSRAELARRFKLGEIAVTVEAAEVPLFDRIAEGVIGKLAGSK